MNSPPSTARARLLGLAVLLAGALGALPIPADRAKGQVPAVLFLSTNTDEGLTVEESLRRLTTPEHAKSRRLATRILGQLALGPGLVHDAVGEWEGGIENSLLVLLPNTSDADTLRRAAAWFGLAADQKAVLAFRPDPWGTDVLVMLAIPEPLAKVRALLDLHGIPDRTILVDPEGCKVFVLDEAGRRSKAFAALARSTSGRLTRQRGHGETLAGATVEEARLRYHAVLRGFGVVAAPER